MSHFWASADRWGVSRAAAILLNALAIGAVPVLAALFFLDRQAFRVVLNEDGVVEWAQVLLWAASGAVGAWIAAERFRSGYRGQAILWIGFGLAALVLAGEELSWGQRLLDLETPKVLEEINRQDEINLHNIGRTLTVFNIALFIASAYAIAAEWIQRRWNIVGRFADGDRLYVPPFFLAGLFAIMVGYRFVRWVILNQESYALTSLSEWAEVCFAGALFITVFLSARWLSRRARDA